MITLPSRYAPRPAPYNTGETYENVVKMTFSKGTSLDDPSGLFNSRLKGKVKRAIDFRDGDRVNKEALKTLFAPLW